MADTSRKNKSIRILLLPLLLFLCLFPLIFLDPSISTDIQVLLPRDRWISSHLDFLQNSQIGSIIALSIEYNNEVDEHRVSRLSDILVEKISGLPGIENIFAKVDPESSIGMATFLFKHRAMFSNQDELEKIDEKISLEGLDPILKEHYETVLQPGGLFRQKMISADPLNLFQVSLENLRLLGRNSGFKFKIHDSGLWSNDNRHLLLVIYTNIPVTDPENAESLHNAIKAILSVTIPDNKYIIMSGHRHAIDNRHLLKRDIYITLMVAAIGFFLLFALCFRDWRALFVFFIPVVGMVCAVGLTLAFFRKPSAIIIGLGATVIGIALDYGIHVFVAAKHTGLERQNALHNIRHPLFFSALTTLGVFWAFFFSGTPGYHQLAFASTCGIATSLLFSLVCLPPLLPEKKTEIYSIGDFSVPEFKQGNAKKTMLIWLVFLFLGVVSVVFTGFEPDIRKLDGISKKLLADEEKFRNIWGENKQAAVSIISDNFEEAIQKHDLLAAFAAKEKIPGFQSLSLIWPSRKTRKTNAEIWDKYWKSGKEQMLRQNLVEAGGKYSFSNNAFQPFFDRLYLHDFNTDLLEEPAFEAIKRKFINHEGKRIRVTAYFDDIPESVDKLKKISLSMINTEVISPKFFGDYISSRILKDAFHIALIALFLVVLLAFLCLKDISKTAVSLIPVISSILIIIPVFAILGLKINAVAFVAAIVVSGLAIDYGIFVVSACDRQDKVFSKDAFTALTLSVLSTVIGAAALLWAKHPALRTVGLVISCGVTAGYFSAVFVSPALYKLICRKCDENQ